MTTKEVKSLLRKNHKKWPDFIKWMRGQTVEINENGEANWYDCDVERFIINRLMTTEEYIDKKYDEMFDWIIKNGCCDDLYELVIEVKSASDGKTIRRSWRDREERLNDQQ